MPCSVTATPIDSSVATQALAIAALGASVGGIAIGLLTRPVTGQPARDSALFRPRGLLTVSAIAIALWLIGQGPSVWYRTSYLGTDGIPEILRLTGLIAPIVGLAVAGITALSYQRTAFWIGALLAASWWFLLAATGTRIAVAFPFIFAAAIVTRLFRRKPRPRVLTAVAVGVLGAYFALCTFWLVTALRSVPLGMKGAFDLVAASGLPPIWESQTWGPIGVSLVASVSAAAPIIEASYIHPAPLGVLLANANPLPSGVLSLQTFDPERLWPYSWVPLSFLGEWYAHTKSVGQFGLWFAASICGGIAASIFAEHNLRFFRLIATWLVPVAAIVSIQYSSRNTWRVFSLEAALLLVALLVWLSAQLPVRRMRRHGQVQYRRKTRRTLRKPIEEIMV